MPKNSVHIRSLELSPPVVNGSGVIDLVNADKDWNMSVETVKKLGAFVTKTITKEPRAGNPYPWAETIAQGTLVNAVGLANPGINRAMTDWSTLKDQLGIPVIMSVASSSPSEMSELIEVVTRSGWVDAIELNLSCPNVSGGLIAADYRSAEMMVSISRNHTELPLIAKLTPACGDIKSVVKAVEHAGADALNCGNTMPVWVTNEANEPLLSSGFTGGISGQNLHALNLYLVSQAALSTTLPIIGLGGVDSKIAAKRMFSAGASIIGVGTGAIFNPNLVDELANNIW